ncbi:MAG: thiol:disulfide interchange protein DsbD [Idiomarinaceae bacterium HL-53]|nr:MAG: thiol:disulfide interchange protein DsbD [Idiomarinaceae bacterium HL-53]CUS49329.1 thiol:disulfide interchange protein DsbD [Idiomarinaceae bacterium HL-53]
MASIVKNVNHMKFITRCFSLWVLLLSTYAPHTLAATAVSEWVEQPHLEARLISEFSTISPGHLYTLAVQLEPEENWHTYWVNPGDSGTATQIQWQGPEGSYFDAIQWPQAKRYEIGPLVNYGFSGSTYLLTDFSLPSDFAGEQVTINARVDWLVCEEICIPGEANLSVTLQVGMPEPATGNRQAFIEARQQLPDLADWPARYDIQERQVTLLIESADAVEMAQEQGFYVYVGATELVEHAEPWQIETANELLILRRPLNTYHSETPAGFPVQFVSNERSLELYAEQVEQPEAASTDQQVGETSLLSAVFFAFLGGLILNLMPCVFPVLSLKALAMAQGGTRKRSDALWYTAGVVISFVLIAAVLIALRAAGEALGWGFQLQNPWLIAGLALLFVAIGLNLSGLYQFGTSLMNLGQSHTQGNGSKQSFATGVLAVIVASPCTAPFMGVALGYAIVQPPAVALIVFAALGLGLAAPFLLIGFVPAFARILPKPGAWMERFKQWMAFPMYLTTVWLLWVFGRQAGINSLTLLLIALVLFAAVLWWWGQLQQSTKSGAFSKIWLLVLALLTASAFWQALAWQETRSSEGDATQDTGQNWQPWSEARMNELLDEQPVFVNMTADWCITCLANERVALNVDATKALFEDYEVAYLKGDWTMQDPAITEYLAEFGRNGVPLYVLYWPGKEPKVLPQILSPSIIREQLETAAQ